MVWYTVSDPIYADLLDCGKQCFFAGNEKQRISGPAETLMKKSRSLRNNESPQMYDGTPWDLTGCTAGTQFFHG
jgi:hypothetical protein